MDEDERHEDWGELEEAAGPWCERCGLAVLAHVHCPACGDPYAFDESEDAA